MTIFSYFKLNANTAVAIHNAKTKEIPDESSLLVLGSKSSSITLSRSSWSLYEKRVKALMASDVLKALLSIGIELIL